MSHVNWKLGEQRDGSSEGEQAANVLFFPSQREGGGGELRAPPSECTRAGEGGRGSLGALRHLNTLSLLLVVLQSHPLSASFVLCSTENLDQIRHASCPVWPGEGVVPMPLLLFGTYVERVLPISQHAAAWYL